jgi:hypothetical protein
MSHLFGESGKIKQPGAVYAVAQNGLATYDVRYKISDGNVSDLFEQGSESEDYPNCVLVSGRIIHTGDASCTDVILELHYEGKDTTHTNPTFTDVLSMDITCSVEPIDTHPNFINFAGTRSSPLNGAKYDARDGRFLFFQPEDPDAPGELNKFAGVRSYNCPIQVISQNRIDTALPDSDEIALVGKIIESSTLINNAPSLDGERNYLYTGIRIRSIGNVYFETTRTAALSGPRKWIDEIYDPIKSQP